LGKNYLPINWHIGFWVIDFCHPSARFGNKVAGAVAFGLSAAINYLDGSIT